MKFEQIPALIQTGTSPQVGATLSLDSRSGRNAAVSKAMGLH